MKGCKKITRKKILNALSDANMSVQDLKQILYDVKGKIKQSLQEETLQRVVPNTWIQNAHTYFETTLRQEMSSVHHGISEQYYRQTLFEDDVFLHECFENTLEENTHYYIYWFKIEESEICCNHNSCWYNKHKTKKKQT